MCVCGMCRIMSWLISLNNALDNVPKRVPDDFYLTLISLAPTALSLNETSQETEGISIQVSLRIIKAIR